MEALPAWNGHVVSALHRMRMSRESLAKEIGFSRQRLYNVINSDNPSDYSRSLVEDGLRSYAAKHGFDYEELVASENQAV